MCEGLLCVGGGGGVQGAVFQEITVTGELNSAIDRMARRGEEAEGGGREKRGRDDLSSTGL